MSTDPAMGEYLATGDDLPAGGVFNSRNLQTYHYAGNNPIMYTDPTGKYSSSEEQRYVDSLRESDPELYERYFGGNRDYSVDWVQIARFWAKVAVKAKILYIWGKAIASKDPRGAVLALMLDGTADKFWNALEEFAHGGADEIQPISSSELKEIRETSKLLIIGVNVEINRLLEAGYAEDSEEIQTLRGRLATATDSYNQANTELTSRGEENAEPNP